MFLLREFGELMLLDDGYNCNVVNSPECMYLKGHSINTGISDLKALLKSPTIHITGSYVYSIVHRLIDKCSCISISSKMCLCSMDGKNFAL